VGQVEVEPPGYAPRQRREDGVSTGVRATHPNRLERQMKLVVAGDEPLDHGRVDERGRGNQEDRDERDAEIEEAAEDGTDAEPRSERSRRSN